MSNKSNVIATAKTGAEPGSLGSRYSADAQERGAKKSSSTDSSSGQAAPSDAHGSIRKVDQFDNLMDTSEDGTKARKQEKARHPTSWDTSLVGRLLVWLVFFAGMFLVTFFIPYWFIGIKETTDGTSSVSKDQVHPVAKPLSPGLQDRMESIKSVILQNDVSSLSDLNNEQSDAHFALRWITEQDPAQIEPLVNHHDNVELLQRYAMAVLFYATHPIERANTDAPSQESSGSVTTPPTETSIHLPGHGEGHSSNTLGPTRTNGTAEGNLEVPNVTQGAFGSVERPSRTSAPHKQDNSSSLTGQSFPQQGVGDASVSSRINSNRTTEDKGSGFIAQRPANKSTPAGNSSLLPTVAVHLQDHIDNGVPSSRSVPEEQIEEEKGKSSSSTEPAVHLDEREQADRFHDITNGDNITDTVREDGSSIETVPNATVALIQKAHLAGDEELPRRGPVGLEQIPQSGVLDEDQRSGSHFVVALRDEGTDAARLVELERENQRTRRTEDKSGSPAGWLRENRWMTSAAVCDWYGIVCEKNGAHNVIKQLNLTSNNLKGTLPSEIQTLTHLEVLDVSKNHIMGKIPLIVWKKLHLQSLIAGGNVFSGTIPSIMVSLRSARNIDLSFNALHGTIPTTIAKMSALQALNFEGNVLQGTIPPLTELTDLTTLRLGNNILTGDIPYHISLLKKLQELSLQRNLLTGTFLPEIEGLHSLKSLDFSHNQLQGELPGVFERLGGLELLNLQQNNFKSTLPVSIGRLVQLTSLVLSSNEFEGTLPQAWLGMTSLQQLLLDHNKLEGTLPMRLLAGLTNLENLTLSVNAFQGPIPEDLANIGSLENLELAGNQLTGSVAKLCELKKEGSLQSLTADCQELNCKCCDNCDSLEPQRY